MIEDKAKELMDKLCERSSCAGGCCLCPLNQEEENVKVIVKILEECGLG